MRRMHVVIMAVATVSGFSWALRGGVGAATALGPARVAIAQGQPNQGTRPATPTAQSPRLPDNIDELLDPKRTVVVVHEIENDWSSVGFAMDKGPGRYPTDHILQPLAELLAAARAKNVRIAHVRWTNYADGSTSNNTERRRPAASAPARRAVQNVEGTSGWEAPEIIKPMPGEWVLPKWRQDAFFSTQLDSLMRWNGIKTMLIVGLGASAGIPPTVVHASSLGYYTVAVEDCMTTSDEANWHDTSFKMIGKNATMMKRKQIIDIWNKAAAAPAWTDVKVTPGPGAEPRTVTFRGREIPNAFEEIVSPRHTVLLVHEMLNDFISKGGVFDKAGRRIDADAILDPMAKLIAAARAAKVRVAYVRWTNYADRSTSSEPNIQSAWKTLASGTPPPVSTVEGTWGWRIPDAIKPAEGDWVIRKYRPDAFYATPLDSLMRWNAMRTIVVVGIGAEVGVVPTLMTAGNLGYFRVAAGDLLRPTNPARMDDAMRYIADQATVKTHADLIRVWSASKTTQQ